VTGQREAILSVAAHLEDLCNVLGQEPHGAIFPSAPETVVDVRIEQLRVACPQARSRVWEQVRRVAHTLHTGGDVGRAVAGSDGLGGKDHRLETGAAHLVDRGGGHPVGQTSQKRGLPRGSLAETRGDDIPDKDLVDLVRRHAATLQRGLNRPRA